MPTLILRSVLAIAPLLQNLTSPLSFGLMEQALINDVEDLNLRHDCLAERSHAGDVEAARMDHGESFTHVITPHSSLTVKRLC